jgi:hypothetical protein
MNVTATPAPKSSVILEVEVPAERLDRAVDEAVRALGRRTRVAGFRPGKAPRPVLERVLGPGAVLDEAVDRLVQGAYRDALIEQALLPLTNPDVEIVQAEEARRSSSVITRSSTSGRRSRPSTTRRSTGSSRSSATRMGRSRRSRIAPPRRATTRSSRWRAAGTGPRSKAGRLNGCP